MRDLVVISALAAYVAAILRPQASEDQTVTAATLNPSSAMLPISTLLAPDSTSLNMPITTVPNPGPDLDDDDDSDDDDGESSTSKKNPHWESIPILLRLPVGCMLTMPVQHSLQTHTAPRTTSMRIRSQSAAARVVDTVVRYNQFSYSYGLPECDI